jgi:hypothetical protein
VCEHTQVLVETTSIHHYDDHAAYLPKVIRGITGNDTIFWQVLQPEFLGFQIRLHVLIALKVGCIQAIWIQSIDFRKQFPRIINGIPFEVITETPTTQHFKKRMMVRIPTNVFQIVVLASGTNAFLRVGGSFQGKERRGRIDLTQENGFELIHTGVCEQKSRVKEGSTGGGGLEGMLLGLEVVQKGSANLFGRPIGGGRKETDLLALDMVVLDKGQAMFLRSVDHRCQHDNDIEYDESHSTVKKNKGRGGSCDST